MTYQKKGVIRQQKGLIRHSQCVISVMVYSKRCDMRGNLIPACLDGLAAMDRRHQHHQHTGSRFVLVLLGSGLLGWKSKKKQVEVIHSSKTQCGPLHSRLSEKKITQTGTVKKSQESIHMPRAYLHFGMIAIRQESLQLFFVTHIDIRTLFSFHLQCFFFKLSALAIKHCTSCGCTKIMCTTLLCSNNCPDLWCTEPNTRGGSN